MCSMKSLQFFKTAQTMIIILSKKLEKKFMGEFEYLGETFSVPIEKEVKNIDEDSNEIVVTISYKINFIDSARFMASSLANLLDNLAKDFTKLNVKIVIVFLNIKVLMMI